MFEDVETRSESRLALGDGTANLEAKTRNIRP
jgi:hypothetical protein